MNKFKQIPDFSRSTSAIYLHYLYNLEGVIYNKYFINFKRYFKVPYETDLNIFIKRQTNFINILFSRLNEVMNNDLKLKIINISGADNTSTFIKISNNSNEEVYFLFQEANEYVYLYWKEEHLNLVEAIADNFAKLNKYLAKKLTRGSKKSSIKLVLKEHNSLVLRSKNLNFNLKDFNLNKTYNDGFIKNQEKMIAILKKNRSGLHLLHGKPGCGKTTYIKYLCSLTDEVNSKKILYLSPDMSGLLSDPGFLSFLSNNATNSILIIEDAEAVLCKGKSMGAISNIRNMTDGIMGDILNIQIIATFNARKDEIDEALMRPGRLLSFHELTELEVEKANVLLTELNKPIVTEPIRITEIYNIIEQENDIKEEGKIGF